MTPEQAQNHPLSLNPLRRHFQTIEALKGFEESAGVTVVLSEARVVPTEGITLIMNTINPFYGRRNLNRAAKAVSDIQEGKINI